MNKIDKPKLRVGLAYDAFYVSFKKFFPELEIVRGNENLEDFNLIIFPGGEDINPAFYKQKVTFSTGINDERDRIELNIFRYCVYNKIKILGVCRGHQLINALLGGDLVQDITYDERVKSRHIHHEARHILQDTCGKIGEIFSNVNSLHHQGVISAGRGLKVTSSYRGIIESCEGDNIITVQFHPEFMMESSSEIFFNKIRTWSKLGKTKPKEPLNKKIPFDVPSYTSYSFIEQDNPVRQEVRGWPPTPNRIMINENNRHNNEG